MCFFFTIVAAKYICRKLWRCLATWPTQTAIYGRILFLSSCAVALAFLYANKSEVYVWVCVCVCMCVCECVDQIWNCCVFQSFRGQETQSRHLKPLLLCVCVRFHISRRRFLVLTALQPCFFLWGRPRITVPCCLEEVTSGRIHPYSQHRIQIAGFMCVGVCVCVFVST